MVARTTQRPLRWYQFRLRTLVAAVTLIVGVLGAGQWYLAPYRQQRAAMKVIEGLGGSYATVEASLWHRRLLGSGQQDITLADLSDCNDPAAYLAHIERLPLLEVLAVGGPAFGDEQLGRLKRVRTLRFLVLDGASVSEEAVAELRRSSLWLEVYRSQRRTIGELKAQGVGVRTDPSSSPSALGQALNAEFFQRAAGAWAKGKVADEALRKLGSLEGLTYLTLSGTDLNDDRMQHLRGLGGLVELRMDRTQVTDAGMKYIGGLRSLSLLSLASTRITDAGLKELSGLKVLQWLVLQDTEVTDDGLTHLTNMPNLWLLLLGQTRVTNAGLAQFKEMERFTSVDLSNTQVSDAGLIHLKELPTLRDVSLRGTEVTDEGLKHLEGVRTLWTINLTGTHVTEQGVKRFKKARPNCLVMHPKFGIDPAKGPPGGSGPVGVDAWR